MPKQSGKRHGILDSIKYAKRHLEGMTAPIQPHSYEAEEICRLLDKLARKYRKRRHERSTSRLPLNRCRA